MSDASIERSLADLTARAGDDPTKTRHVAVGHGILDAVGPWLNAHGASPRDVLVCDTQTQAAAGDALRAALQATGRDVTVHVVAPHPGEDEVVCDDAAVAAVRDHLAGGPPANAIAVGAGTINDLVKMATTQLERSYVGVATAASMNGYTSAIAAVLSGGVKRTLPTRQAVAVFADVDVIRAAPAHLNQAGFGDLLSKPYSNADWLLSHLVRGVAYEREPAELLDEAYEDLLLRAEAIGRADPVGIGTLTRTILLSGFTMAIAGTSAPASGGEHLVSHYWDMEQHCRALPLLGLHGTQVGIATRLSALLFERVLGLDPKTLDLDAASRRFADPGWMKGLSDLHPRLTPAVVEEVREQIAAKQLHGKAHRDDLDRIVALWPSIRPRLAAVLKPAEKMTQALREAGAPDRPSRIACDRDRAIHTLRVCRHIRGRYVALDLLDDLGLLHEWAADAVDLVEGGGQLALEQKSKPLGMRG
jgi:glycerol-1-phosphate dehydrogenase [NAD(P)+]